MAAIWFRIRFNAQLIAALGRLFVRANQRRNIIPLAPGDTLKMVLEVER